LLGAALCISIMFFSNLPYALVAIVLTLAIYKYVEWKGFGRFRCETMARIFELFQGEERMG
jgi:hypothetical protein